MRDTPSYLLRWRLPLAIMALCLMSVVLMTSLLLWSIRGLDTYVRPSVVTPGQVPHFVCTADGDGTILRCGFSAIAKPRLSRTP